MFTGFLCSTYQVLRDTCRIVAADMDAKHGTTQYTYLIEFLVLSSLTQAWSMRCCLGDCYQHRSSVCGIVNCSSHDECASRYQCISEHHVCLTCSSSKSCSSGYVCSSGECVLRTVKEDSFLEGFAPVIGGIASFMIVIFAVCMFVWWRRRQQRMQESRRRQADRPISVYSLSDLEPNTHNVAAEQHDRTVVSLAGPNEPPPFYSTIQRTGNGCYVRDEHCVPPSYEEVLVDSNTERA